MAEHVPIRTCVGCRRRAPRSELVRHVAVEREGRVVVERDTRGAEPGRGAWLCDDASCSAQAERRRAWRRALRVPAGCELATPSQGARHGVARHGQVSGSVGEKQVRTSSD